MHVAMLKNWVQAKLPRKTQTAMQDSAVEEKVVT